MDLWVESLHGREGPSGQAHAPAFTLASHGLSRSLRWAHKGSMDDTDGFKDYYFHMHVKPSHHYRHRGHFWRGDRHTAHGSQQIHGSRRRSDDQAVSTKGCNFDNGTGRGYRKDHVSQKRKPSSRAPYSLNCFHEHPLQHPPLNSILKISRIIK